MTHVIIIMGVSGSGKTTIGKLLAEKRNIPFFDGDDFHPKENIKKMTDGFPLNDEDRKPWLESLANKIAEHTKINGAVIACSALKESYRQILTSNTNHIHWVFLSGDFETIKQRLEERNSHFMKSDLLTSQFDALEVPKYGLHVSIKEKSQNIVNSIIKTFY